MSNSAELGDPLTNTSSSISKDQTPNSVSAGNHNSGVPGGSITNNPVAGANEASGAANATTTGTTENKYPAATLNVHPLLSSMVVYTHPLKFQGHLGGLLRLHQGVLPEVRLPVLRRKDPHFTAERRRLDLPDQIDVHLVQEL